MTAAAVLDRLYHHRGPLMGTALSCRPTVKRLPPFGKAVASRLAWGNPPAAVLVTVGAGAWDRAKKALAGSWGDAVLLMPHGESPATFTWPVSGLHAIVETAAGPNDALLAELASELLNSGASLVAFVREDWRDGAIVYDRDGFRRDIRPAEINEVLGVAK